MDRQVVPFWGALVGQVVEQPRPAPAPIPAVPYDAATAEVLDALDQAADEHLGDIRPRNTKRGYANDWALWTEYLAWLAEKAGRTVPETAVTKGTLVGFVRWLDVIKEAAPSSIDRRITGVTVTARTLGVNVTKDTTVAARQALKPIRDDPAKQARGRGKAHAVSPAQLRSMASVPAGTPLADLRDRALTLIAFSVAGRSAEVAALTVEGITEVAGGLEVKVPKVKTGEGRTVAVARGTNPDRWPVRAWLAWKAAAGIEAGPAFRAVDRWGNISGRRMSPDACRLVVARAAERAGIEQRLTGHSMRAGLITTARKERKRVEKIREQSGHAANSPVFWEYVRDADRWDAAATDGIGL